MALVVFWCLCCKLDFFRYRQKLLILPILRRSGAHSLFFGEYALVFSNDSISRFWFWLFLDLVASLQSQSPLCQNFCVLAEVFCFVVGPLVGEDYGLFSF